MNSSIELLLQQDNSQKKILNYVRENTQLMKLHREYGSIIANKYLKVDDYDTISEIDKDATHYIDIKKYNYYDLTSEDFAIFNKAIDLESVIRNERVFRYDISYQQAMELVFGCTKFFIELFKNNKYDILLTHIVDEFIIDILVRVAQYFNIEVVSYCINSFDKKYIWITERGEYVKVRQPSESEIDSFLEYLTEKTSKPYFLSPKKVYYNIFRKYFLYKVKYILHYQIMHKLFGNNAYRLMMTLSETYPRRLNNIINASRFLINDINAIPKSIEIDRRVYIPLHYHPESTTEYWISDPDYISYYPSVLKTIRYYSENGYQVLVKEHPASYMQRDVNLYEAISKISNVYLLSPFITTYEVLDLVEYVIVWTGTTGVEAIMQNKKVILAAGENYYSFGKLASVGQEDKAKTPTNLDKWEIAESILSSFLPII